MLDTYNTKHTYNAGDTTLNVNAVSGILVKNYRNSFFYKFNADSPAAEHIFNQEKQFLYCADEAGGFPKKEEVVIVQCMILPNNEFLAEMMWKEDFEKMFGGRRENEKVGSV